MIRAVVFLVPALFLATHEPTARPVVRDGYEASIRRTSFGVAHIRAEDLGSLGFGEGYAQAEDHLCTIADQVVLVRGERARYFGRGERDVHVVSDIAMRALRLHADAGAWLGAQPAEARQWTEGFVAGYNHYLAETGRAAVAGWCRGEEWVTPITALDLAAYERLLTLTTSAFAGAIVAAQPPAQGGNDEAAFEAAGIEAVLGATATASNGWGIGRDATRSGGGILLANPHYPWAGANRFWEKHLTIPGDLDVYGVSLIGFPGVLIGFTEGVAWTHTISAGRRFTVYALELVPGDPTRYRYGDEIRAMEAVEVTVEVRGEAEPVRHTAWRTHYGPVIAPAGLAWTESRAFALRDAAAELPSYMPQQLATNRARSLGELQRAHAEFQAVPSFTTVAVDAAGVAWFSDAAATPHVGDEALSAWRTALQHDPLVRQLWQNSRIMLLDGSDPRFEWVADPQAVHPGLVPFEHTPQLERTDHVFNANNSFWIAHADARVEGDYSILHGEQRTPLSLRGRQNARFLGGGVPEQRGGVTEQRGGALEQRGGATGLFDREAVRDAALGNHSLTADLLVTELIEQCATTPSVSLDDRTVDLTSACAVLRAWDRRFDLGSRGAVLFREWLARYDGLSNVRVIGNRPNLFAVDFDPSDPLNTPRGLAPGPLALENLAHAVLLLEEQRIALDAPLGELQYAPSKLPRRLPVHGGKNAEGVLNLMLGGTMNSTLEPLQLPRSVPGSPLLTDAGYPILHGTSFVLVVELTADGPRGEALLAYGQSGDPDSPHFTDQTELFARKQWRPVLFREEDVARDVQRGYTVRGVR
jgi:acyl-homoserine-lactone acylase